MKKVLVILLFVQLCVLSSFAQEVHNSQYNSMPLYLNPANTGNSNYAFRGALDIRNQWSNASVPFTSQYLYGDIKRASYIMEESWFGLGVNFLNDVAGDGIKSTYVGFSCAFHKAISRGNDVIWSNGINVMLINKAVDYNNLKFGSQWKEEQNVFDVDQSLITTGSSSLFYPDIALGSKLTYYDGKDEYSFGVSVSHLNQPGESFYKLTNNLARKFTIHGGVMKHMTEYDECIVNTSFVIDYQYQDTYGLVGFNVFRPYDYKKTHSMIVGLWYRTTKEIIPCVGMEFNNYKVMATYDISLSNNVYKNRGSFEISLTYTTGYRNPVEQVCKYKYLKPLRHKRGAIPCPKFKTGH